MRIEEFDRLDAAAAAAVLRPCVAIERWVGDLVEARPYGDTAALVAAAESAAATWTRAEVEGALADHPRIGERHLGDHASATLSRGEQSGVSEDADLRARLADGNRRYEERFDRIYLVRAAGRSAEDMLDLLEERLGHDDVTEFEVTRGQLAEIAVLRLRGSLP